MAVSEFVILIDEQEKNPYYFSPEIKTEKISLKTGDYSIKNLEDEITIERKSLSDYISSITAKHDRFFRELNRMQKFKCAVIVVEGHLPEITSKLYEENVTPDQIIGLTISILIDKQIPVLFCTDRQHALHLTERILKMYWEHKNEVVAKRPRKSRRKKSNKDDLL